MPQSRRKSSLVPVVVLGGIAVVAGAAAWKMAYAKPSGGGPPPLILRLASLIIAVSPAGTAPNQQVLLTGRALDQNAAGFGGGRGSVTSNGVVVPGASWASAVDGSFSVPLIFTADGSYNVIAVSGGVASIPFVVTVSTTPPPNPQLTRLAITESASTVAAGGSASSTIQAFDQNGVLMAGIVGAVNEAGAPAPGGQWTTDSTGTATVTLVFPVAGQITLTAVSGAVTSNSTTITVTPSTVTHTLTTLTITESAPSVSAGGSNAYTVIARDQTGAVMGNVPVQLNENGSTAIPGASGTTDTTGTTVIGVVWPVAGSYPVTAVSGAVTSNIVMTVVSASASFNVISNVIGTSPAGQTTVPVGTYIQYQALGFVTAGSDPLNIPVRWLVNGADVEVPGSVTGPGGGAPGQWSAYWGQGFPTAGTYTIQAVVGGFPSNTLTLTVT